MSLEHIHLLLPEKEKKILKLEAIKRNMSMTQLIRQAIALYLSSTNK